MSKPTLRVVKPSTEAERTTRSTLEVCEVTPGTVRSWKLPPFQRPLRVNDRVHAIAKQIAADDGVIPGVLTIGVLGGEHYLIDGQHRREAFLLSECLTGYVDIRYAHFGSMEEMADEFFKCNSRIVNMRPDDYLRALESTVPSIAKVRQRCPFVGYDMVRRGDRTPVLSMSAVMRSWWLSAKEVPGGGATSAVQAAREIEPDVDHLIKFLEGAFKAWGRDPEYYRLWGNLNLTLNMWLYRRTVVSQYSPKTPRLTTEIFTKCMATLSADGGYLDYLVGRNLTERDRSPCYARIKVIYARRLMTELGGKPLLPAPAWQVGH